MDRLGAGFCADFPSREPGNERAKQAASRAAGMARGFLTEAIISEGLWAVKEKRPISSSTYAASAYQRERREEKHNAVGAALAAARGRGEP